MVLVLKKMSGTGFDRRSLDLPAPTIMADGLGGISRRGWQYWVEGLTLCSPGVIPRENELPAEEPLTLWLAKHGSPGFKAGGRIDLDREPCPTVMAGGMWGGNTSQYRVWDDGRPTYMPDSRKPPYRVPSMAEIAAVPWNGFTVASTFSGGGGSCTGYRMAGFRVAWANEFVPVAQESYRANAAPGSVLDGRDIRAVQPGDILRATNLAPGELDLLDGSPPCQAFSSAGSREKGWGKGKRYEHGAVQCNETLFSEYVRLLRGLTPKVFVAENVSGLIKGTAKGFFLEILAALKASGYRVEARLLDAQWLGVPQARQRLIFVGVRNDLGLSPAFPRPLSYNYSVRDALPWVGSLGKVPGGDFDKKGPGNVWGSPDEPCPTITGSPGRPPLIEAEADISGRVIGLEGANGFNGHRMSGTSGPAATVQAGRTLACHVMAAGPGTVERRKFSIAELRRICSFPDDFRLCGSYAQQWSVLGNSVPPIMMKACAAAIRDRVLIPARDQTPAAP